MDGIEPGLVVALAATAALAALRIGDLRDEINDLRARAQTGDRDEEIAHLREAYNQLAVHHSCD